MRGLGTCRRYRLSSQAAIGLASVSVLFGTVLTDQLSAWVGPCHIPHGQKVVNVGVCAFPPCTVPLTDVPSEERCAESLTGVSNDEIPASPADVAG